MISHLGYLKILTYAYYTHTVFFKIYLAELSADDDLLSGSQSQNGLKWGLTKLVPPWVRMNKKSKGKKLVQWMQGSVNQ